MRGSDLRRSAVLASELLEAAAVARGVAVERLSAQVVVVAGPGGDVAFNGMNGPLGSVAAQHVCDRTDQCRALLERAGLPVPDWRAFGEEQLDDAVAYVAAAGVPVVLRPRLMTSTARRVRVVGDVAPGWADVVASYRPITPRPGAAVAVVEHDIDGVELRVFVVGGRVVAAVELRAAEVVGDGSRSVERLIRRRNRRRRDNPFLVHFPIPRRLDRLGLLVERGGDLDVVPADGEVVRLRRLSEGSGGQMSFDVTRRLHAGFGEVAVRAVGAIPGLRDACVHLTVGDIGLSPGDQAYAVRDVEFALAPTAHHPWRGRPRDVAGAVLDRCLEHEQERESAPAPPRGSVRPVHRLVPTLRGRRQRRRPGRLPPDELVEVQEAAGILRAGGANLTSAVMEATSRHVGLEVDRIDHRLIHVRAPDGSVLAFDQMNGPSSSAVGRRLADHKELARRLLQRGGVRVVESAVFAEHDLEQAIEFAHRIDGPVVVKPTALAFGRGVTTGVETDDGIREAWERAVDAARDRGRVRRVLVERHVVGRDYRVYVVDDDVIATTRRDPANVRGDGVSTVADLIRTKNAQRMNDVYLGPYLIPLDPTELDELGRRGRTLDDVPAVGEVVQLRSISNLWAGGDSIDLTDVAHPEFDRIAVSAVAAIPGLRYAGIDVIAQDISVAPSERNHIVSEVNFAADPVALFPWAGPPRDMAGAVLDLYLPAR